MVAGLRQEKLSRNGKVKVCFFPGAKTEEFYYYLIPLLRKKPDNIILRCGTNDAPYKKKDAIYKELKSMKNFINKRHPSCKEIYININVMVKKCLSLCMIIHCHLTQTKMDCISIVMVPSS